MTRLPNIIIATRSHMLIDVAKDAYFVGHFSRHFVSSHEFSSHRYKWGIERKDFLCSTIMMYHYHMKKCNLGVENDQNARQWRPYWKMAAPATLPPAATSHHGKWWSTHSYDHNDISHYKLSSKLPRHHVLILHAPGLTIKLRKIIGINDYQEYNTTTTKLFAMCGGPYTVGAPVRSNMLNMPKSGPDRRPKLYFETWSRL